MLRGETDVAELGSGSRDTSSGVPVPGYAHVRHKTGEHPQGITGLFKNRGQCLRMGFEDP